MKTCDNCSKSGGCNLEKDARACMTNPVCGFHLPGTEQLKLNMGELKDEMVT